MRYRCSRCPYCSVRASDLLYGWLFCCFEFDYDPSCFFPSYSGTNFDISICVAITGMKKVKDGQIF
ncbi:hypothetical protein LINPERPRIM_LOCUS40957 [Linum perenne]